MQLIQYEIVSQRQKTLQLYLKEFIPLFLNLTYKINYRVDIKNQIKRLKIIIIYYTKLNVFIH